MLIRRETGADRAAISDVHARAFRSDDPAGEPVEVGLVEELRRSTAWLPRLSLVAVAGGEVVGHVVCSRAWIGQGREAGRVLGALGVANRLKFVVDRPRPDAVRVRELQENPGFPSSHAAVAFALATLVAVLLPRRWRWVPPVLACVVAATRMHVGVHYPLDLVGGALVGTAVALATVAA